MKNKALVSVMIGIGATMLLSGCGKSAVECGDSKAQKAVMEIIEQEFTGMFSRSPEVENPAEEYRQMNLQLANIRTESVDNELEKSECVADMNYAVHGDMRTRNITYNLSKTSEGELYVEVYGLSL